MVHTVNPRDWPKNLETAEDYIIGFCGVDGQPLGYGLRDDLISPVARSDPTFRANGRKYFTHDDEMSAQVSILSGPAVLGTDPEEISPFAEYLITVRELIWENMVAIFEVSDTRAYLQQVNKNRDGRLGFRLI